MERGDARREKTAGPSMIGVAGRFHGESISDKPNDDWPNFRFSAVARASRPWSLLPASKPRSGKRFTAETTVARQSQAIHDYADGTILRRGGGGSGD
jgi:hypothetical protein